MWLCMAAASQGVLIFLKTATRGVSLAHLDHQKTREAEMILGIGVLEISCYLFMT